MAGHSNRPQSIAMLKNPSMLCLCVSYTTCNKSRAHFSKQKASRGEKGLEKRKNVEYSDGKKPIAESFFCSRVQGEIYESVYSHTAEAFLFQTLNPSNIVISAHFITM